MLRTMLSRFSSHLGSGSRRSLRDATSTLAGSLPIAALLAVMSVVFCSTASAQTAYFSGAQIVLPNSLGYSAQDAIAVDASGNVYVSDSSGAVYEMEAVNGILPAAPVTRTLGSGFSNPQGVAVDAHGDVFVADLGSGLVKEIVAVDGVIPASPTIRTLNTGSYTHPYGVAVDASGDVFVSNLVTNTVYEMVAVDGVIPSTPTINPLGNGYAFNNPTGLAVDASGNVYVADEVNSAVEEITAASGYVTVKTLGSGFLHPEGVVVDAYGNVYVADSGNHQVKEIVAINGVIPSTPTIKTLGSGFSVPKGVALDSSGDLFVADDGLGEVFELQQPGGNFGQVNVGTASATITMTFTAITAGTLGTPAAAVVTQGRAGLDFTVAAGGTCSGLVIGAGNVCTVNVTFTPGYPGERSGAVVLKDHLGTPIATGYLQGVGVAPQVSFLPATAKPVGSGFATPGGLAIDAHGDIFVADTNNAQVKEILVGSGSLSPLASGVFSLPIGVAVDGDANVFVSDTTLGVVEILSAGSYLNAIPLGSGFSAPQGIAVDGFGNVYVADTGNDAVKELTVASGYAVVTPLGSGFSGPSGVAVDAYGDVFVADTGNNAVKEIVAVEGAIPALSPTIHTLAGSYSAPRGVALDGVGNLYVADTGNGAIKEITLASGYSTVKTLLSGIISPIGVTVSQIGDVYYTSASTTVAEEAYSVTPSMAFGNSDGLNIPTPDQTVTVQNIGNAKLLFATPTGGEVNNPAISAGFKLDTNTLSTACLNPVLTTSSSPVALPAGESCTLSAYFDPTATGPYNGSLIVYDNHLNETTNQSITLSGTGLNSQTITFTPVATPVAYGTTQLLSASSTSGLAITFSVTGPGSLGATVCTLGTCTAALSYNGVGTVYVTASQAGNATVAAAASVTQDIVVNQAAQTITFTPPASPVIYSATLGTIPLSATASSGLTPVTFSLVSGPGSLSGANNATLTVTGPGTIVIAANQAGNAGYSAAPQVTQSIVVDLGTQTINFTAPASPITYTSGMATIPLSATSTSGLAISFSIVSGPGSLSGANNATLTVTGVGTIVIAANQAGNTYFAAAPVVDQSIVVNQGTQTITFTAPASPITYTSGMATIPLVATSPSGLPVSFSILSGPGSLSGANNATLTVTGVGTIVIAANQAGNTYFAAAPVVDQSIVVNQGTQTITFTAPTSPITYTSTLATIPLVATSPSGLAVSFSILSGPGSLSGANNATLTVTGVGTIVIAAYQAGNTYFAAAPVVDQSIVVNQGTQTIAFIAPASSITYTSGMASIPLSATASSGLAVTFSIVSGPGTLSGANNATLTVTGVGIIVIAANQPGNTFFAAAPVVDQSIVVNQGTQTITFPAPASPITYTSTMGTISLSATASSGLAVTFSLVSGPGSLSGANNATLTVNGVGTIVIAANQPGNTYFAAAPVVDQSIVVNGVPIAAAPTFALPAGTYALQQSVVILDSTPGATIYFTTDGSTPTPTNGTPIPSGTAITVSKSETVEAMAVAPGYINSPVAAADYIINPTGPDFTVTASPTSVTVTKGQSVATMITVTPLNGFVQAVSFTVSGLPSGATYTFAPTTVTPAGGPVSTMLTITTTAATATLGTGSRPFFPATALALALCCFGIRKRRRILRMMVLLLVGLAGLGLVNGCAGSVGYTTAPTVSSLITVTATPSSGSAHTTSFLLGVQP